MLATDRAIALRRHLQGLAQGRNVFAPPTVGGDRVYMVTNRNEVVCLDLHGLANGNDGPCRDEARRVVPTDKKPLPLQGQRCRCHLVP